MDVTSEDGRLVDAQGLTVEDFGLVDNLMMIHALELHGCPLVTPARDADRRLARSGRVRGLRPDGGRAIDRYMSASVVSGEPMSPARKRADVLLVERGLFESRARARAAIEAGLVTAERQAGGKTVRDHRRRTR